MEAFAKNIGAYIEAQTRPVTYATDKVSVLCGRIRETYGRLGYKWLPESTEDGTVLHGAAQIASCEEAMYDLNVTNLNSGFMDALMEHLHGKVCIAGGAVLSRIYRQKPNDYDMYIIDPRETQASIATAIDEFAASKNVNYHVRYYGDSLVNFEFDERLGRDSLVKSTRKAGIGLPRISVQLCTPPGDGPLGNGSYASAAEVISKFDMAPCQIAYLGNKGSNLVLTQACAASLYLGWFPLSTHSVKGNLAERIYKYTAQKGFGIYLPGLAMPKEYGRDDTSYYVGPWGVKPLWTIAGRYISWNDLTTTEKPFAGRPGLQIRSCSHRASMRYDEEAGELLPSLKPRNGENLWKKILKPEKKVFYVRVGDTYAAAKECKIDPEDAIAWLYPRACNRIHSFTPEAELARLIVAEAVGMLPDGVNLLEMVSKVLEQIPPVTVGAFTRKAITHAEAYAAMRVSFE